MPKTRTYSVVGREFFEIAPTAVALTQDLPVSAEAAFRSLEDADAWPVWLDSVSEVIWSSERPFGIGTTRNIKGRAGTIGEVFFDWIDGERMSFYFASGAVPLAAFAESWELRPTGEHSCELTWRYGYKIVGPAKLLKPVIDRAFKFMGQRSLKNLDSFLADSGSKYQASDS
jgi:hypothetical protein